MGTKHRKSWSDVDDRSRDFESGYWAGVARLERERVAYVINIVDLLTLGGWLGRDPRYRVLVGRTGTQSVVGVGEARTARRARRHLAEVQVILATSTGDEARDAFDLDF